MITGPHSKASATVAGKKSGKSTKWEVTRIHGEEMRVSYFWGGALTLALWQKKASNASNRRDSKRPGRSGGKEEMVVGESFFVSR